ncbi:polynucleotidyl transferase ribonuclease H fold [Trifolium medium]|uniref:Polynucleotidyl transferase ribonuclease H fold n=1 Tax=Trifolium medium TaxID=97028 RepID=A0A392PW23_9FABA|nr:polynucleotidyl transferase ribonuclease H fold [Trifolium medium]
MANLRDCLPIRTRLRQHFVPCPTVCQFCQEEEEDVWRILFDCRESKQCWTAAGLKNYNNASAVILDISSSEDKKSASHLGMQAAQEWNEWSIANEVPGMQQHNQAYQQQTWQPPSFGWLKCNADFHDQGRVANRGWCIRNYAGNFIYRV